MTGWRASRLLAGSPGSLGRAGGGLDWCEPWLRSGGRWLPARPKGEDPAWDRSPDWQQWRPARDSSRCAGMVGAGRRVGGYGPSGFTRNPLAGRRVLQLASCFEICRSVQLVLHSPKVWIWAVTVLGLAGPWSRTTRNTVACRASSRVVSSPMT